VSLAAGLGSDSRSCLRTPGVRRFPDDCVYDSFAQRAAEFKTPAPMPVVGDITFDEGETT